MKRVLDATNRKRERASAVCERDAQFWEAPKHSTENHRADCQRSLSRHAHQPWQPIFRHSLLAHHVPRMDKDRAIQILCGFPENIERRMIKVPAIGTMTIFVRIDVRANFGSTQSELAHAAS